MKKVLVIRGQSKYNVLVEAAAQIAAGFEARGYEVKIIELDNTASSLSAVLKEAVNPYSFLFSCQALCFETMLLDGRPLVSAIPNMYIGWIFDDVIYHWPRVENARYDNTWLLTIDKECGRAIQKMCPEVRHVNCLHHGGFCATITGEKKAEEEFWNENKKDIDVLFSANLGEKPDFEGYMKDALEIERFLAENIVGLLKERPYLAIRKALELVVEKLGQEVTGELLLELNQVITIVDRYIRWQSRYDVLLALLKAGIRVTLIGDGEAYEQLAEEYPNQLHFIGGADILDVVRLMARSKVVINPCAIYTEGLHERLCTALLCRAVCFTPWASYLESNFGNLFQYMNLDNLEEMTTEIQYILEHPETIEEQIERNYAWAMEYHTWKKRGEEIIDFYESQIAPAQE